MSERIEGIIKNSGLKKEEVNLLSIMDIMLKEHRLEMDKSVKSTIHEELSLAMDEKLKTFESNIQPIFDEMMKDHISIVNRSLNSFLRAVKQEGLTEVQFKKHLTDLKESISSDAIEEARTLTSADMQRIYKTVVEPIKNTIGSESDNIVTNLETMQKNIMDQARGYASYSQEIIEKTKSDISGIKEDIRGLGYKVEAVGKSAGFMR